jgi:phage/plasmid-like protein (TIGR03299 family)
MAHSLTIHENGAVEMAYAGAKTPWHGLGNNLAHGASIEEWKAAAGMAWSIESAMVQYTTQEGTPRAVNDRVVLYRSDDGAALGVVSDGYKPVHPGQVLEFFRDLTTAAGFTLETAGTLFGGKRLWALASIGAEAAILDPRDKMKGYLLLSTACDGSMCTEARYTTVRVVCNNTLGFARNGAKAAVKVTHRSTFDPAAVKRELGIEAARTQFADTMAEFRTLAQIEVTPLQVITATAELFHPGFDGFDRAEKMKLIDKATGPITKVGELALNKRAMGSEYDGTQGTAYGWLNAVTEHIDHEARAHRQDTRLNSAWFGKGEQIKERAHQMAVEMIAADGSVHTVYRAAPVVDVPAEPIVSLDDILAATPAYA